MSIARGRLCKWLQIKGTEFGDWRGLSDARWFELAMTAAGRNVENGAEVLNSQRAGYAWTLQEAGVLRTSQMSFF